MRFFHVSGDQFDRLVFHAIDVLENHAWFAHGQLIAFAAHVFQQDGQVQLATTSDFKNAVFFGFAHAQSHIRLQFFLQTIPDLATGYILAFAAREWRGVDAEVHRQRRLINFEHRQRCWVRWVSQRHADADVLNAVDQNDVAWARFSRLHAIQALEFQDLIHAAFE